jgi:hypothetical protein
VLVEVIVVWAAMSCGATRRSAETKVARNRILTCVCWLRCRGSAARQSETRAGRDKERMIIPESERACVQANGFATDGKVVKRSCETRRRKSRDRNRNSRFHGGVAEYLDKSEGRSCWRKRSER